MTTYNIVLATDNFTNMTFLIFLNKMWIEFILILLFAYFIAPIFAKKCAFRVVQPEDRPIFIIFAIQTFTVIIMAALASINVIKYCKIL